MGKREASRAPIPSSPKPLKRPRTPRAARGAQISSPSLRLKASSSFSVPEDLESDSCCRQRSRDWANLDDGPAGLIAEIVLAADVADYIRFRAVCRPWRRCSADPRACGVLDRRFRPRQWIMLWDVAADPQSRRRRFLNVCSGQFIQVELPELVDHRLLLESTTTEGLLVLLRRATNGTRLLNPLTRQAAELPRIATSLTSEFRGGTPDNAGLADDHTVVLYFCRKETLAFAKPGDEHWVLLRFRKPLVPTMSFAGRFYGVTSDAVMVVDTGGGLTTPRLVVAAELAKPVSRMADTVHLVDNGGELILVHSKLCELRDDEDSFRRKYKVYRLDLDAGKMIRVRSLSGRAVFIGRYRVLSVSPQVFPYISSDTVCPGFNLIERTWCYERIGAYSLKDGSIEPPSDSNAQSRLARPWSIADLLAAYVSG